MTQPECCLYTLIRAPQEKHDALRRVVEGDPSAPAAKVHGERVIWLADPAAAGDLPHG